MDTLLAAGLIVLVSCSEWLAPIVIAPKKGPDKYRFCVGYCALNDASITDGHPLPNVDAVLDAQAGFPYYSVLDGFSGYYAIPLHPESTT